ncbi:MAG: hypothetical protein J6V07_04185 [Clostridia bacterium]|nr:hypothetical protein [Clostridia bacterium]
MSTRATKAKKKEEGKSSLFLFFLLFLPGYNKEVYIYNRFRLNTVGERNLHHTQTAEVALGDLTISIVKV